ncbi:MAG: hypothetical protein IPG18_15370 [Saprospiraceae bacterium]|nr:hypothetical protein [Saprospiraceae bacterium]
MKLVQQTYHNVFLTGKAGTGKTTLLKKIIDTTHKNAAVVAQSTGIAALNAGGVTIHSFSDCPGCLCAGSTFQASEFRLSKIESLSTLSKVLP